MSTPIHTSFGFAGGPHRTHRLPHGAFRHPVAASVTGGDHRTGELDAANAQEFVDYALRHAPHIDRLVLDLTGVDFSVPRAFPPCTP